MSKNKISPHYPLFEHMSIEHDLVLTENELQEIINVVRSFDSQTQELIEQNRELVSVLKKMLEFKKFQREEDFISIEELEELLTKYNHLNQKP